MPATDPVSWASERLRELPRCLYDHEGFAEVVASLKARGAATLDGAWGSSCALAAAALVLRLPGPLIVVYPQVDHLDDFADDFRLFTGRSPEVFPAWETTSSEQDPHAGVSGERTRILKLLREASPAIPSATTSSDTAGRRQRDPLVIATSIQALLQPVPEPGELIRNTRVLRVGDVMEPQELMRWLAENGFHSVSAVALPGEMALRGGILDIFAAQWRDPVRIEFFGDSIESIRRFELASQRSLEQLEAVDLSLVSPTAASRGHFAQHLPESACFFWIELEELREHAQRYRERLERPEEIHDFEAVTAEAARFGSVAAWALAPGSLGPTCRLQIESVERFSGDIAKVRDELDAVGDGREVFVVCQTEAEAQRLGELFAATRLAREGRLFFPLGRLAHGFHLLPERLVLVSSNELFHRTDVRRVAPRRLSKPIDSFSELREGSLVVHVSHGIARYRGMKLLEKDQQVEEHLVLEFQDEVKLYVPTSKIHLVQKYLGGSRAKPRLAKLGGRLWGRQKQLVERAVTDLAAEMLEIQAIRASRPGIAFPPDTEWQREFDASFPYQETEDQLAAIEAIKQDMRDSRPMDRLICGDVGFGKTELAMRAAFKAVDAGYQVAVLVPTTVLAEQHYRTFCERMAEYPFAIARLSRFATRKEQAEILERLAAGSIDIVIGTHRLAQPDVRFRNLGLVVIDEEQRFGVEIKERLKALRQSVDVLTMTATPIPRTLHMALLGLRDICNLQTPPEDRLAVETHVTRFDPRLIRQAVLRELNRQGQVFFVHNRVHDIESLAERLRQIVPEARLAIGHAQMPDDELERVMLDFLDRRYDILLSTTIVESGLDIPNANTMFIDEADRYGLADLHQLRGRVGRYKHRAYCYLLVDPTKPIPPSAARRLRAIEEFSELGAGFAVAMRDLEIRGAGNLLGTEQSGHIAMVGYELYCQLLEQAVAKLKHCPPKQVFDVDLDLPGEAYLPRSYVPGMREKIDLYRRLARACSGEDLKELEAELLDRFGPMPPMVRRLLTLQAIRIAAQRWLIASIRLEDCFVVFGYMSAPLIHQLAARHRGRLRVADDRSAYLPIDQRREQPDQLLAEIHEVLCSA